MKAFAEKLAHEAGALLKQKFIDGCEVHAKSPRNLVTEADLAAESLIRSRIESAFPDHAIVGEEMPERTGAGIRWYVDPLDGTTNFAFGIPHWCVSIGAIDDRGLLAGAVFDPLRDELFSAGRGEGATRNGFPIRVKPPKPLEDSLIATGFASMRGFSPDNQCLDLFERVITRVQGVRRMGSAALDLAYVACGRVDLFYEEGLSSWDTVAGAVIVQEAGGTISGFDAPESWLESGSIIAAHPQTAALFLESFF